MIPPLRDRPHDRARGAAARRAVADPAVGVGGVDRPRLARHLDRSRGGCGDDQSEQRECEQEPHEHVRPGSLYSETMGYRVITPQEQPVLTRRPPTDEPARHVTELSDVAGMEHVRANVWRYEPGATGRRHRHPTQDETFVVLRRDPVDVRRRAARAPRRAVREPRPRACWHAAPERQPRRATTCSCTRTGWPPEDESAELLAPGGLSDQCRACRPPLGSPS